MADYLLFPATLSIMPTRSPYVGDVKLPLNFMPPLLSAL